MMMTDAELKFNYVNMCDNLNKSVVEINVTNYCWYLSADGRRQEVHFDKITYRIKKLCYGLNMEFVDPVCKIVV